MEERYLQECPKCGGEGNIGFSYNKKKCKLCGGTGEVYMVLDTHNTGKVK